MHRRQHDSTLEHDPKVTRHAPYQQAAPVAASAVILLPRASRLKQIRGFDLVGAVRMAASGRSLLDPRAAGKAMARLRGEANRRDRLAAWGLGLAVLPP